MPLDRRQYFERALRQKDRERRNDKQAPRNFKEFKFSNMMEKQKI